MYTEPDSPGRHGQRNPSDVRRSLPLAQRAAKAKAAERPSEGKPPKRLSPARQKLKNFGKPQDQLQKPSPALARLDRLKREIAKNSPASRNKETLKDTRESPSSERKGGRRSPFLSHAKESRGSDTGADIHLGRPPKRGRRQADEMKTADMSILNQPDISQITENVQEFDGPEALPAVTSENLKQFDELTKQKTGPPSEERVRNVLGTPLSRPSAITPAKQDDLLNPNSLPENLNLGFGDSASQRPNDLDSQIIPSAAELQNRPFASNLENAKILANLTKHRVSRLNVTPARAGIVDSQDMSAPESKAEYERQKKLSKYLSNTLKHLNLTIDILIEQYDPVKLK